MSPEITAVTAGTFDQVVLGSDVPVLVDYWARGCGPCRMLAPILREIAADLAGALRVVTVDGDHEFDLVTAAGVRGFPTLHLYRDGSLVTSIVGARPKARLVADIHDALRSVSA